MGIGKIPPRAISGIKRPAFLCALQWEADCLPASAQGGCSGMGHAALCSMAASLCESSCDALISFGSAGALAPDLQAGDLVLSEWVVAENSRKLAANSNTLNWAQQCLQELSPHSGGLIQTDEVINCPQDKLGLFKQTRALAVDMESATIARLAQEMNIPFLAVRVIIDRADQYIPMTLVEACDNKGQVRLDALLVKLARQPGLMLRLPGLARSRKLAKHSLCNAARLLCAAE